MTHQGRPSSYTDAIAAEICRRLAAGESLSAICRSDGMPSRETVMAWTRDPAHAAFLGDYARAREDQADYYADQVIDEAFAAHDNASAQVARVRIDALKWVAGKLRPKQWGDLIRVGEETDPARKSFVILAPRLADSPEEWAKMVQQDMAKRKRLQGWGEDEATAGGDVR
jgi:hypothetical protein